MKLSRRGLFGAGLGALGAAATMKLGRAKPEPVEASEYRAPNKRVHTTVWETSTNTNTTVSVDLGILYVNYGTGETYTA